MTQDEQQELIRKACSRQDRFYSTRNLKPQDECFGAENFVFHLPENVITKYNNVVSSGSAICVNLSSITRQ